ncbi:hypothetical protein ACJIZ3_024131 [Penstemon smallii]|uniref:Uncharacterized protein n=1 Tax=Penstemon smallii TaxID=265156 RepID=A0ABD3TR51_9LAMI
MTKKVSTVFLVSIAFLVAETVECPGIEMKCLSLPVDLISMITRATSKHHISRSCTYYVGRY